MDCSKCQRIDVKCCYSCKKEADKCKVYHKCGSDCPEHESRVITNADKIRSMDDEELAEFLYGTDHYVDGSKCIMCFSETRLHDSKADILEWLQSEAE